MKSAFLISFLVLYALLAKTQVPTDSLIQDSLSIVTAEEIADTAFQKRNLFAKSKILLAKPKDKATKVFRSTVDFFNFKKDYPSPKKALLLTAVFPGMGQIYNKKYWKLPLVYGGVGSMVYFIIFTRDQYHRYRRAYIYRLDELPGTVDEFTRADGVELLSAEAIRIRRDQFRKRNELSYIGLGFAYILAGVDAFVDAHLMRFDVSDDLSLQWQPHYEFLPNRDGAVGVYLSLQPKAKKAVVYPIKFSD